MKSIHRSLVLLALFLGGLATVAGDPYIRSSQTSDVTKLAAQVEAEEDHVTALELARWIRDRKQDLEVIDVRPAAEFEQYHIPSARNVSLSALASAPLDHSNTLVLYSGGGAHAAQAWVFLQMRGYEHVYFLRGGLQEWMDEVMNPTLSSGATAATKKAFEETAAISRYFGGAPHVSSEPVSRQHPAEGTGIPGSHGNEEGQTSTSAAVEAMRRRGC